MCLLVLNFLFDLHTYKVLSITHFLSYLGHIFLSPSLKKTKFVFLIPKPIVERFLASYILIFVKNYHMGLNNPHTPSEMGESKLDKNGGVYVGSLDPYVN